MSEQERLAAHERLSTGGLARWMRWCANHTWTVVLGWVAIIAMMGGALGLAVLASLAASRTETLTNDGSSELAALAGGYHAAFLVGAIFAAGAAAIGALMLRPAGAMAMHAEHADGSLADPA